MRRKTLADVVLASIARGQFGYAFATVMVIMLVVIAYLLTGIVTGSTLIQSVATALLP